MHVTGFSKKLATLSAIQEICRVEVLQTNNAKKPVASEDSKDLEDSKKPSLKVYIPAMTKSVAKDHATQEMVVTLVQHMKNRTGDNHV